jgi:flagellar basal-body rod protein FlgB
MKTLFPQHVQLMSKVMDLRLERQNIVASNLANINTPGYKSKRLEFEKELQSSLQLGNKGGMTKTDAQHMPTGFDPENTQGDLQKDIDPRVVRGEDRVDLDEEMSIMSKNSLAYKTLSQLLRNNFSGMEEVIREGSK